MLQRRSFLFSQAEKEEDERKTVELLKTALEDVTAACILEGFQRQDHLMLVDAVLKELGRRIEMLNVGK